MSYAAGRAGVAAYAAVPERAPGLGRRLMNLLLYEPNDLGTFIELEPDSLGLQANVVGGILCT